MDKRQIEARAPAKPIEQLVTTGLEGGLGLAMTCMFFGTMSGLVLASMVTNLSENLSGADHET
jgi:hypothetical protein